MITAFLHISREKVSDYFYKTTFQVAVAAELHDLRI